MELNMYKYKYKYGITLHYITLHLKIKSNKYILTNLYTL